MAYDRNNVFAKILRGELPCRKVYENPHVLAFHDIQPDAPVHVLVVPKGEYVSLHDFALQAPEVMVKAFFQAVAEIAEQLGLKESGYRVITNHGPDAAQAVPHFHVHVLGGRPLGKLTP